MVKDKVTANPVLQQLIHRLGGVVAVSQKIGVSRWTIWKWLTVGSVYNGLPTTKALIRIQRLGTEQNVHIGFDELITSSQEWKDLKNDSRKFL